MIMSHIQLKSQGYLCYSFDFLGLSFFICEKIIIRHIINISGPANHDSITASLKASASNKINKCIAAISVLKRT